MYPVIAYTLYITTCVLLSAFLLFQKRKDYFVSICHFRLMRLFAILLFIDGFEHLLLFLGFAHDIDVNSHLMFLMLFLHIISIGLFLTIFSNHFTMYNRSMHLQRLLMWLFIALGALHPLLFANYCGHNFDDISTLLENYQSYIETMQFKTYIVCVIAMGILYLAVSLFTSCRFAYKIIRWYADPTNREGLSFAIIPVAVIVSFVVVLLLSYGVGYYLDVDYHLDLPLWALYITTVNFTLLNNKEKYVQFIRTYVRLKMLDSIAKKQTAETDNEAVPEDSLHQRERIVVLRTLQAWAERNDNPFMSKGLTLSSLSDEIGIPEAVLVKYINSEFGLYFNNYIDYLKEEKQETKTF